MRSPYCGCQASLQLLCTSPAQPDHLSSPSRHTPLAQHPGTLLAKVRHWPKRIVPHHVALTCTLAVSCLHQACCYSGCTTYSSYAWSSCPFVMTSILLSGESKAKPRTFISTPASISLAVKNNQGVQAGQGCMQPGAWRGCKKSAW